MPVTLPLSRYDFEYRVLQDAEKLPAQPGVIWHSVLGKSLKSLVCVAKGEECSRCMLAQQCDYTQLFTGIRPENSEIMRKYNTVPAPHVFQTKLLENHQLSSGEMTSVSLVLCGHANDKLPSLARAFHVAGKQGLGKHRATLQLVQIRQYIGGEEPLRLLVDNQLRPPLPAQAILISEAPKAFSLKFITPYKPSGKANHNGGIDFGRLLMAIIRRVDLMQYFSTGVKLDEDFKALKILTDSIQVVSVDLAFSRHQRYSAAENRTKDTSGFVGSITFDLQGHEKLWPFIVAGEKLNVGKNASMGFGRYIVGEVDA